MRELIVDNFAGGGGASTGIAAAVGRDPDYAINHDELALAMHRINHPDTKHLCNNVWKIDPDDIDGDIGLGWFSPDCKHFSKAKGGKPVDRGIRDLAWVVVRWARRRKGGPRVIILENVEEFADWGPLVVTDDGKLRPCPERRGATFKRWVGELRRLGYRVEWRELRACDYGAPTIRKRLFLIARRDGKKIVWPTPTHGAPTDPDVVAGRKLPWRTAAEIIDWSLPCHSIFLTREEGRAVGVNRPLADATMARIAKGVKRYVLDAAQPFVIPLTHQGGDRAKGLDVPLPTVTGAHRGEQAVVAPVVVRTDMHKSNAGCVYEPEEPLRTVTSSGGHAVVAPVFAYAQQGGATRAATAPMHTVTASRKDQNLLVAAHLTKFRANSIGSGMGEPAHTVTANSFIKRPGGSAPIGVVAAFMAQHNLGVVARDVRDPLSTVTSTGAQQQLVSAGLMHMKGSDRRMSDIEEPARTVTAGGWHQAEVRAFMVKYYSEGGQDQSCAEPVHTVPTRDRFGLVMVEGEPYQIVDIGMRMLSTRELFRAQGFPESYVIDRGVLQDGLEIALTKTASIRMCGNSVCPPVAEAIVRANYVQQDIQPQPECNAPGLFGGAAA
jgi:DNA (cytosine-5)-methyltransferase 1